MKDYYQYVIRVNGKLKWFFVSFNDIDIKDITIEKINGSDIPPYIRSSN